MRILAASVLWLAVWPLPAQTAASIPRTRDDKPDFTGFWNLPYVPNMAQGKEADVPYTDLGRKAYEEHDAKDDPTSKCWYPGVPRIMQSPYPVQIAQTRDYLLILFEYMGLWRSIPLDGRPHPENMEPNFMGHSVGQWDGDTLRVDTVNLKGAPWTWLDTAGHQHTDALRVTENFRRTPEGIDYEYTVNDPTMYAQPWVQKRKLTPLKTAPGLPELIEYACTENNLDLQHLITTKPGARQ
jgi:hypothetical protein